MSRSSSILSSRFREGFNLLNKVKANTRNINFGKARWKFPEWIKNLKIPWNINLLFLKMFSVSTIAFFHMNKPISIKYIPFHRDDLENIFFKLSDSIWKLEKCCYKYNTWQNNAHYVQSLAKNAKNIKII